MKKYKNPITGEMHPLNLEDPKPGIYEGVSHRDYIAINAMSRSKLADFARAPEVYLHEDDEKRDALAFGTQYHAFLLQPDEFETEFTQGPEYKRSNADKETWEALRSRYGFDNVYRPSHLERFKAMKKALQRYDRIYATLMHRENNEITIVAQHPETGIMLKARIDAPKISAGWIVDLKTFGKQVPDWDEFKWSVKKYGYDLQAGFYPLVCSLAPGLEHMKYFEIIAQSKIPPYIVRAHRMDEFVNPNILESNNLLIKFKEWIDSGGKLPDDMQMAVNYWA